MFESLLRFAWNSVQSTPLVMQPKNQLSLEKVPGWPTKRLMPCSPWLCNSSWSIRPNWCDLIWKVLWPGKMSIDHWVSQLYFQCSVPLQIGIKFFHIKILWIKFLRHAKMRRLDKTLIRLSVRAIKWSVHTFDASPSTLTSGHLESNHALESFSFTNSSTAS